MEAGILFGNGGVDDGFRHPALQTQGSSRRYGFVGHSHLSHPIILKVLDKRKQVEIEHMLSMNSSAANTFYNSKT